MRRYHLWRASVWRRRLQAARLTATWSPDVAGAWDTVSICRAALEHHLSRSS